MNGLLGFIVTGILPFVLVALGVGYWLEPTRISVSRIALCMSGAVGTALAVAQVLGDNGDPHAVGPIAGFFIGAVPAFPVCLLGASLGSSLRERRRTPRPEDPISDERMKRCVSELRKSPSVQSVGRPTTSDLLAMCELLDAKGKLGEDGSLKQNGD